MNLDELRTALTDLDGQLVELVARRQALSEQVAAVKRATGRATRDFGRERDVILRGRNTASRLGVSPDLAESLAAAIDSIVARDPGAGPRRCAGARQRQARLGDRRPRQDGRLVRRISRVTGFSCRHCRSHGRPSRLRHASPIGRPIPWIST